MENRVTISKREIIAGLRALGLRRGYAVEIHGSLRSVGWVEGGAGSLIHALMEVVGPEGALVMSAYPVSPPLPLSEAEIARGITWKVAVLGEREDSHTGLGAIVDTFRSLPGTFLGEGLHRVRAWGRDAALYAQKGYAQLVENDGWTLLIGVGIDRCSSMHLIETRVGIPEAIRRLCTPPDALRREYPIERFDIGYGGTPEDAWGKVWDQANRRGLVRKGFIGQAASTLFKTRAMLKIYEQWLREDPFGLYGVRELS